MKIKMPKEIVQFMFICMALVSSSNAAALAQTEISSVSTGTVRVNTLGCLEGALNILANAGEICLITFGAGIMLLALRKMSRRKRLLICTAGLSLIVGGFALTPGLQWVFYTFGPRVLS